MKNENPALPNKNTLIIGRSGSGKSNALRQLPIMKAPRMVLFDPNTDHKADVRARDRLAFLRALSAAVKAGGRYRVAYTPLAKNRCREHEFFCEAVCAMLDGKKPVVVVDEELARSCKSAGKAEAWHGQLINEGRKYGMIYQGVVQIPQRVPKDVFDNCETLIVGNSFRLPEYVTEAFGVSREVGISLKPLEFMICGADGSQKRVIFKYKKRA